MAQSFLSGLIHILLPLVLFNGSLLQFSIVSFIYGFLLLILPWLGTINSKNIQTRFRSFILVISLISLLAIIVQIIFQSILLANRPYSYMLNNYTKITQILRCCGLEWLDKFSDIRILCVIFPDIVIFIVSTICFVIIQYSLYNSRSSQSNDFQTSTISHTTNISSSNSSTTIINRNNHWSRLLSEVRHIRLFIEFIIVGFTAFVKPSLINSIYFILFLIIAFMWSLSVEFGRKFALIRALLVVYTGIYLILFYLYQLSFFQEVLPASFSRNITDLRTIVTSNCTENESHVVTNLAWNDYVNSCALWLLYFYFAFETNQSLFQQKVQSNATTIQSIKRRSLINTVERRNTFEQYSSSSQCRWSLEQSNDQTWQEQIIFIVYSILGVLERQSYFLSLIAMLAWSITFHSLLTLVYLLLACLLWILSDSRKWCLRMSPFFTIYGGILLILQYISGFRISFNQLNFAYDRRTMEQIGIRIDDFQPAFIPLLLKSFYKMFFWLTLRQYINEKRLANTEVNEARRNSIPNDSYPRRLGQWLINLLTKYWICVSCGMLLLVSIQNTVVIYRIIYMVFYLFFIISFQISFGFWRKTAATFYLIILIYSMLVLIGIYIYQFEKVHVFLSEKFSIQLFASIGLEVVPSDVLALKLLTPSTFLVVNIMQLYYFHSGWMNLISMSRVVKHMNEVLVN
ncbi:unnamed protein product [Rotaria sp. Silwood1]|nr:unnamed protein product [Rotaria sp. Silwood1]